MEKLHFQITKGACFQISDRITLKRDKNYSYYFSYFLINSLSKENHLYEDVKEVKQKEEEVKERERSENTAKQLPRIA